MASGGNFTLGIDFRVNKGGLSELNKELDKIQNKLKQIESSGQNPKGLDISKMQSDAKILQDAVKNSWNSKLNQLDLSKMQAELKRNNLNIQESINNFTALDGIGKGAFKNISSEVINANVQIKKGKTLLDQMAETMSNTVKWGITSSLFNKMTDEINNAWNYAKALDSSLNDIRIVTGKSSEEMANFAVQANKVAKSLGAATKDYTNASLIYYQQGLDDEDVQARAQTTLKAANVTGQTGQEVSEQLTAVWNGYKVEAQEAELYVDKLAAVAADTAADLEELSTGMSKVASAANLMGVDIDQLNAQLATIVSVTRQAPESVGTALKTIYARMGDIQAGLDGEVTLDEYTSQMAAMGVNVLDASGKLRDMGVVIEEIGEKWTSMSREQQISLSQTMAGTRQYNNLLSLFDNWDMYTEALNTSKNSVGELQRQEEIYLDSISAKYQQLATEIEKSYDIIFNEELIKGMLDGAEKLVSIFNNFLSSGGLQGLAPALGFGVNLFSSQIASSLTKTMVESKRKTNNDNMLLLKDQFARFDIDASDVDGAYYADILETYNQHANIIKDMGTEEQQRYFTLLKQKAIQAQNVEYYKQQLEIIKAIKIEEQGIEVSEGAQEPTSTDVKNFKDKITEQIKEKEKIKKHFEDNYEKTSDGDIKVTSSAEDKKIRDSFKIKYKNELDAYEKEYKKAKEKKDKEWNDANTANRRKITTAFNKEYGKTFEEFLEKKAPQAEKDYITEYVQKQEKAYEQAKIDLDEYLDSIDKLKAATPVVRDAEGKSVEDYESSTAGRTEQEIQDTVDAAELQKQTETTIQVLSSLFNVLNSIVGVFRTLGDETISIKDKIAIVTTSVIALGFALLQLGTSIAAAGGMSAVWTAITGAVTSAAGALGGFIAVAWPFILIAGAVALAGMAIYNAMTKDAQAYEAAKQKVEELSNAYNEASQSAQNFKDSISNYDDAKKALEELEKGTDEYNEKLKEANENARALMEQTGNYDYHMENGLITFDDPEYMNKIQAQLDHNAKELEQLVYSAKISENQAFLASELTDFSRGIKTTTKREKMINGDYYNKTIAVSKQDLSTITNALLNAEQQGKDTKSILLNDESLKDFIGNIENLSPDIDLLTDNIVAEKNALISFVEATKKATDANEYYAQQRRKSEIEQRYGQEISEMSKNAYTGIEDQARANQITEILSNMDSQKKADIYANNSQSGWMTLEGNRLNTQAAWKDEFLMNRDKQLSNVLSQKLKISNEELYSTIGKTSLENAQDLAEAYAKMQNISLEGAVWEGKQFIKDNEVLVDMSSNEKRGAARATIFDFFANQQAQDNANNIYQEQFNQEKEWLQNVLDNSVSTGAEFGIDFSDTMLNALAGDGTIDLSSLYSSIDPEEAAAMSGWDPQTFYDKMLGGNEVVARIGEEKAIALYNSFQTSLSNHEWDIDSAISKSMGNFGEDLAKFGDDLSKAKFEELQEDVKVYARQLMELGKEADETGKPIANISEELEYNSDMAVESAFKIIKMNKAIDTLADNYKDWNSILRKSSKSSQEYAEAMYGMKEAIADVYDVSLDYVSNDFITDHLSEIEKVSQGSAEAIEGLRSELASEVFANIASINIEAGMSQGSKEALISEFTSLKTQLEEATKGLAVGQDVQVSDDFIAQMNNLIAMTGMTVEQANAIFSSLKLEPTYATDMIHQQQKTSRTQTVRKLIDYKPAEGDNPSTWTMIDEVTELPPVYTDVEIPVTAIRGDGKQPTIKGFKKSIDASMNNYSSSNKGGGKPGKSGGSSKKADKKDPVKNKKDVYHDINIILKQISTELDRLEEQEEKLVGQDLIENLNKQWSKLQDTIDATNEKLRIARGEMSRLQGVLGGKGVAFNADGTIANYAAAYDQQLNALNAVINHYNNLSAEAQDNYKDTVEQAEKNWEEFLDDISEYDELISETMPELEDDIQAAINEQIEIQIEKFNMEIEIRLDMAEAEREWNEFKNRIIDDIAEDDILGNTQARLLDYNSYYKDDGTGVIQRNTQHVNDIINQLKEIEATGTSSVYGDNEAQALEDLKTYYEQLMSDLTDVHDLIDEIRESYLSMMDEAQEKFDEQVETYEYIRDLLTHDMDLITMVYGDEAYNKLVDFYEKQEDNYNKQLDFQRQQKDFWKAQMDSLEEGSDEWQKAKENWMSAVEEWNSLVEEAIENLQDKYLNAINNIFANLNDKVTDGLGLEYTKEEWDLINKNADQYLDTINSIFETQQLENKYLDAIDNTDSISAQRKLNDLMKEEIAALEQKDKLTQYDIDRANLKYEIALKQIALEEAQQNKSSMRLRRDSQGNYRYEFVADNEEISALEDELSVLQNQLYNMDVDQYQNNLDQLYEVWVEFQEKMAEAAQINDPEARAERELLIEQQYGELINGIVNENEVIRLNLHESAFAELAELYDKDLESFENLTAAEKDILLGDMVPQWESAMQQMADAFAGEGGFEPTCEEALGQLNEATKDYEDSLRNVENTAGITFDAIINGENEAIQTAQGLLQKNNELINAYNQELNAIRNVIAQLNEMINKYNAAKDAANAATQAAYNYWIQSQNQAANAAANAAKPSGSGISSSNAGAGSISNSGGGGGGGSRQGNGSTDVGDVVTYSGKYYYDSYGTAPAGSRYSGVPNGVVIDKVNGNPYGIHIHSADGRFGDLGWVKRSQLTGYDTGGYTGEWGSDGRLALLHQKEIVLNAKDTENLLSAVDIMRDIVDTVGSSVLSRAANIAIGTGIQTPALTNGALEQNVHIEATFPNVQKSVEIEQALDNLINVASQRANRSNKY